MKIRFRTKNKRLKEQREEIRRQGREKVRAILGSDYSGSDKEVSEKGGSFDGVKRTRRNMKRGGVDMSRWRRSRNSGTKLQR